MEELMVKKSIFKQEQLKEVYSKHYYDNGEPDTFPNRNTQKDGEDYKHECNLSMPLLKKDDSFYIEEDDKMLRIRQAIRTSKDNVLYICSPNVTEDKDTYNKLREELKKEKTEWNLQHPVNPSEPEIKGIRKLVKKLFNL